MNEVYARVTDKIIDSLKQGVIPWRMPWRCRGAANIVSRKPYRGINSFLTGVTDHTSPFWMTYKQAKDLGGTVKKGEKGQIIIFYKLMPKLDAQGQPSLDKGGKTRMIPFLRHSTVFNYDQTEGIPNPVPMPEVKTGLAEAQRVVEDAKLCPIRHGGNRAFWSPEGDYIQMPGQQNFLSHELYYHSLFHEMGHATGHPSRLNRSGIMTDAFGSPGYAKEELVAELTACFLSNRTGIMDQVTFEHPAGYIQSWIKTLQNDNKLIVQASAQAEKAAAFISGQSLDLSEITPEIEAGHQPLQRLQSPAIQSISRHPGSNPSPAFKL